MWGKFHLQLLLGMSDFPENQSIVGAAKYRKISSPVPLKWELTAELLLTGGAFCTANAVLPCWLEN